MFYTVKPPNYTTLRVFFVAHWLKSYPVRVLRLQILQETIERCYMLITAFLNILNHPICCFIQVTDHMNMVLYSGCSGINLDDCVLCRERVEWQWRFCRNICYRWVFPFRLWCNWCCSLSFDSFSLLSCIMCPLKCTSQWTSQCLYPKNCECVRDWREDLSLFQVLLNAFMCLNMCSTTHIRSLPWTI